MTSLKSYSAVIAKRMEFSAFQWISLNRKKLLQTRSYKYMFKIISKVFFIIIGPWLPLTRLSFFFLRCIRIKS